MGLNLRFTRWNGKATTSQAATKPTSLPLRLYSGHGIYMSPADICLKVICAFPNSIWKERCGVLQRGKSIKISNLLCDRELSRKSIITQAPSFIPYTQPKHTYFITSRSPAHVAIYDQIKNASITSNSMNNDFLMALFLDRFWKWRCLAPQTPDAHVNIGSYSEKAWACDLNGITQRGRLVDGYIITSA